MNANAESQVIGAQGSRWMTGLLGRPTVRGKVVCGRLDAFVAPIVDDESEDASDLDWVRHHNAKVRDSLKGSLNLNQRLNAEADEAEQERPPARVVKGEAFMVKMLEQRMRSKRQG